MPPLIVCPECAHEFEATAAGADTDSAEPQVIVHRLDVGTSGVMVVAASERAYSQLKAAFKERTVTKNYHAVVQGLPDPIVGTGRT